MSLMCAYQDCLCIKYPCSRTAFFRLPTDSRRKTWIRNSGNKTLLNISAKSHRFFCENHFRQCDIRTQFNRKILRKHAVPIQHEFVVSEKETELESDSHSSKSIEDVDETTNVKEATVYLIEEVEENLNTTTTNEDIELSEKDNPEYNNTSEEQLDNSYTLMDLYMPINAEEPEQSEEEESNPDKPEDDSTEMYYVETSSNHVDSSTLDLPSDEDIPKNTETEELEMEAHIETDNRTLNDNVTLPEPTNVHVTTSYNDYEEDKHFALSLVGYFQRLPKGKKALAKLKILEYLTELDIGMTDNL